MAADLMHLNMCTHSSDPECWGAGFLQESFRLSNPHQAIHVHDALNAAESNLWSNITKPSFSDVIWQIPPMIQRGYEFTAFTPASASIDVEDFGTRVVPFGWWVYVCVAALLVMLLVHEVQVSRGMRPALAPTDTSFAQCKYAHLFVMLSTSLSFCQMAMMVPISLDVALSLKQSATASGLLLSVGSISMLFAIPIGKNLANEDNWDQKRVRSLVLRFSVGAALISFGSAVFMNATAHSNQVYLIWWLNLALILLQSFVAGLPSIPSMIFWNKLQADSERSFWNIVMQMFRNIGFIAGPLLFVMVKASVTRGGSRTHPRSIYAWINMFVTAIALLNMILCAMAWPVELPQQAQPASSAEGAQSAAGDGEESPETQLEAGPEDLKDEHRKQIVWHMIYYAFERPFTISAVEVATIMMLEVYYGWDSYTTGICFTVISGSGIVLSMLGMLLMARGYVTQSALFMGGATVGLLASFLLFDTGLGGAWTLLVADAFIYGGATLANGIAEGMASRAAKDGTDFSIGEYRMRNFLAVMVARFLGPIVARFLVDMGGRNIYAVLQVILCFVGTRTVYKTCSLIWAFKKLPEKTTIEKKEQASNKLLSPSDKSDPLEVQTEDTDKPRTLRSRSPAALPPKNSPRNSPRSPRQAK